MMGLTLFALDAAALAMVVATFSLAVVPVWLMEAAVVVVAPPPPPEEKVIMERPPLDWFCCLVVTATAEPEDEGTTVTSVPGGSPVGRIDGGTAEDDIDEVVVGAPLETGMILMELPSWDDGGAAAVLLVVEVVQMALTAVVMAAAEEASLACWDCVSTGGDGEPHFRPMRRPQPPRMALQPPFRPKGPFCQPKRSSVCTRGAGAMLGLLPPPPPPPSPCCGGCCIMGCCIC